jgi:DNA-binding NarL/FixJ family response regulator
LGGNFSDSHSHRSSFVDRAGRVGGDDNPRTNTPNSRTDYRSGSAGVILGSGHPDAIVLEAALLTDTHLETLAVLQQEVAIALLVAPTESYSATTLLPLGVKAILPIDVTADELILTVEAISVGLIVLHPDVSDALLHELPSSSGSELPPDLVDTPLTPRELELLQLLATGLGNKAIARQMNISEHTVKFHISSIFCKLNASSRTEAVMLGMRLGLIFL